MTRAARLEPTLKGQSEGRTGSTEAACSVMGTSSEQLGGTSLQLVFILLALTTQIWAPVTSSTGLKNKANRAPLPRPRKL